MDATVPKKDNWRADHFLKGPLVKEFNASKLSCRILEIESDNEQPKYFLLNHFFLG